MSYAGLTDQCCSYRYLFTFAYAQIEILRCLDRPQPRGLFYLGPMQKRGGWDGWRQI